MNPIHLKQLKESPDWTPVRKDLIETTPPEVRWTPSMRDDDWKFQSALRQGYLLALLQLGINYE